MMTLVRVETIAFVKECSLVGDISQVGRNKATHIFNLYYTIVGRICIL